MAKSVKKETRSLSSRVTTKTRKEKSCRFSGIRTESSSRGSI